VLDVLVVLLLSLAPSFLQDLAHLAFFLQHAFSCANAPPEIITAAANNKVIFFIVCDLGCKDKE